MSNLTEMKNTTEQETANLVPEIYKITIEDSNWIMTAAFIIFTMQTGFGMLESGCVSRKNEMNIMMKNIADIFLGGVTYWAFGYGLSFGTTWTCPFFAVGEFFVDATPNDETMGPKFTAFLFQLSFATTATTIVSGAMAERCNFKAYCLFSFLNTIVYCIPAGWVWGSHGFLKNMGVVDIAGSGPVHLVGGASALASAFLLGPRLGRYDMGETPLPLGTPVNCAMGLFVLWWGWLAFNSGSTYGVSGAKWAYSAKAAVMTMISSFGGGIFGLSYTMYKNNGYANILHVINSVLGSLVAVTAGCFLYSAWYSLAIGFIGGMLTTLTTPLFDIIKVDDPVGACAVHGVSGIWGVLAVGLFADDPLPLCTTNGRKGLFISGDPYLLGVQALSVLCLGSYSFIVTYIILSTVNKLIPIRMSMHEELLGADLSEHLIKHKGVGVSRAVSALISVGEHPLDMTDIMTIGSNPGHELFLRQFVEEKNGMKQGKIFGKVLSMFNGTKVGDTPQNLAWIN
ncbi:putative ammonium transporter 3 [Cimex lectularius]|uniref:Ammonium transporter n=1 Tax=Cimex lectularius TaxID=79782 RepID=A0A8I6RHN6_CIMLE|nr:putative ammonium transporter 3 [Cimex lectularius]